MKCYSKLFEKSCRYQLLIFPQLLGNGITSRISEIPVARRTIRSKVRLNPACLAVPFRRRSKYHSYCSLDNPSSLILLHFFTKKKTNSQKSCNSSFVTFLYLVQEVALPGTQHFDAFLILTPSNHCSYLWYNNIKRSNCFPIIVLANIEGLNFLGIIIYDYWLFVDFISQVASLS